MQGAQGIQGTGNQGVQGPQGAQGIAGTGTQGAQGIQGSSGPSTVINAASSSTNEALYLVGVPGTLGTNQTIKACTSIFANASTGIVFAVDFSASSDEKLKKEIQPVTYALQSIQSISGVRYRWIDESRGTTTQIGVIAQDVEQVIPEAVHTDHNGFKSVSYDRIIPLLIEAVKELKARVEVLEQKK